MATYKPIQSFTTTGNESVVTFSNIPQDYTDLVIVSNVVWTSDAYINNMRFNGDAGSNYSYTRITGNGTSAVSTRLGNINYAFGGWTGVNPTLNTVHIMNYSNSTKFKTSLVRTNIVTDRVAAYVNTWRNTAAITSITLTHESASAYSAGSTFSLYGIKAGTPKAFGGDITTTDGTYWYHTFNTSGTFVVQQGSALSVDYLVVAGGGSAGGDRGGGGGAGGYRTSIGGSTLSLAPSTVFPVLVGAGGAINGVFSGLKGSNSTFSTITSTGGGFGGSVSGTSPGSGGSGGGGYGGGSVSNPGALGNEGSYSPVEGFAGGTGQIDDPRVGGGGGGSSAAGLNGTSNGTGGAGTSSSISGTSVTRAGGGGGGRLTGTSSGGTGGGGGGVSSGSGNAATVNTGSGGGGGGDAGAGRSGGAGGSGIVIVRYPV